MAGIKAYNNALSIFNSEDNVYDFMDGVNNNSLSLMSSTIIYCTENGNTYYIPKINGKLSSIQSVNPTSSEKEWYPSTEELNYIQKYANYCGDCDIRFKNSGFRIRTYNSDGASYYIDYMSYAVFILVDSNYEIIQIGRPKD